MKRGGVGLGVIAAFVAAAMMSPALAASAAPMPVSVYAAPSASAETRRVRDSIVSGGAPLLVALAATGAAAKPEADDSLAAEPDKARWLAQAARHVVIVGTPAEGEVCARVAGFTYGIDCAKREAFRLGLGRFRGDVGVVETQFNPWQYSNRLDDVPASALMVRIAGTTPEGVRLAADAFAKGMNNGVVLGAGAARVETSILDLDPSPEPPPEGELARLAADAGAGAAFAGWTQCPAQEYRAYLDWGADAEPRRVWRAKWLKPGSLASADGATWTRSPLAAAFANAATIAEFADESDAAKSLAAITAEKGASAPFPPDESKTFGSGSISFTRNGRYLIFSSLR